MIESFRQLRLLHRVFDAADTVLQQAIGVDICIPGCGKCCQNVPQWMAIEAIYAYSVSVGKGNLQKLTSICEGWLLEHHSFATTYEGIPSGWATPQLKGEWLAISRSTCPFLATNKTCLIYYSRPLTCRAWGVTRDGADICPRTLGKGETQITRVYIPGEEIRRGIAEFRIKCTAKNHAWTISNFVPTVFYRISQPDKFRVMLADNKIASAKLIGIEFDANLMWQPQVDEIRNIGGKIYESCNCG